MVKKMIAAMIFGGAMVNFSSCENEEIINQINDLRSEIQKQDSLTNTNFEQIKDLLAQMNYPDEENFSYEKLQYQIEIDCPKTTLTVGEKIEVKVTSKMANLDLNKVNFVLTSEIIDVERIADGFKLVAKKKGATTMTLYYGSFSEDIRFTVNAKSSSGSSGSGFSEESDSDAGKTEF